VNTKVTSPIKIFYRYAHEDKDLHDRIDKHLGVFPPECTFSFSYFLAIRPGAVLLSIEEAAQLGKLIAESPFTRKKDNHE